MQCLKHDLNLLKYKYIFNIWFPTTFYLIQSYMQTKDIYVYTSYAVADPGIYKPGGAVPARYNF